MAKTKKSLVSQRLQRPHKASRVLIVNAQRSLAISEPTVKKILRLLMKTYNVSSREVVVHFVSRQKIQAIHKRFFNDPTATDCITLPYNEEQLLGELFICPEVARTYAKKAGLNPYDELMLYIVHGFLHLMGFKDQTAAEQKRMRTEETKCLKNCLKEEIRL